MSIQIKVLQTSPRTYPEWEARQKELARFGANITATIVNNGTTEVVHGNNFPQTVEGPTEITAGEEATYTITEFDIRKEEMLSIDKECMGWVFYIDGVEIVNNLVNYLRILNTRRKPESPTDFMAIEDVQARTQAMMDHAILYANIASAEEGQRTYRTKLTVRFSKWLDGHQVHIEAYRSKPDLKPKNAWVATTEVKAEPEILQGYWANDRREKITGRTIGYKDTVYMCLQTLGMQGQQLRAELWEEGVSFRGIINSFDEELLQDNHITFAIEERLSYQKLELSDEDSEEFKKQRAAVMESGDLDLYFTLPDASDIKGHEKKYGRLLYLTTEEKLSAAYFAQAVKREAIKDRRVSEETPEPIHQVKSGETLSKIAPKYGIGWKILATHNNIQSPYTIQLGQELKLPEGATIPEGAATSTASEQGNKKTATAYERIDSGTLGSEVYLVVETANLRGKKVDIEIFDQEKLLAEDDETAIKVIRDDQETDWINAVKIDDTGKAIVKVKLRKKNDEDYKKQQETLKDDKQARLFLKVTCQGDDKKHKKVFVEHFKLISGGECISLKVAKEIALKVSGGYEGKEPSYSSLADNFDGAGMSWGIIQFNFGQNTLGPLLQKMQGANKEKFDACFSDSNDLKELNKVLKGTTQDQIDWAVDMQNNHNARWKAIFNSLADVEEFQEIQLEAVEVYDNAAIKIIKWMRDKKPDLMSNIELITFVALHDLAVQQGSIDKAKGEIENELNSNPPKTQDEFIRIVVKKRGALASTRWRADCISRRLGILNKKATEITHSGYSSKRENKNFKLIKNGYICDL